MGQSNTTNIKNYINNSTNIRQTVSTTVRVGSNPQSTTNQSNNVKISVGSAECCVSPATLGDSKLPDESDAAYKIRLSSRNEAYRICTSAIKEAVLDCDINIKQNNLARIQITSKVTSASNNTLKNDIAKQVRAELDNLTQQSNTEGILSAVFGAENENNTETNVDNSINASLDTSLTTETQSNLRQLSGQNNNGSINVCAGTVNGKRCDIDQFSSVDTYVTNIVGTVAQSMSENKDIQAVASRLKNVTKQKNTNFLSGLIDSLGGIFGAIAVGIIAIIIVIAVCVGIIMVMRSSRSKKGYDVSVGRVPPKASSKVANSVATKMSKMKINPNFGMKSKGSSYSRHR